MGRKLDGLLTSVTRQLRRCHHWRWAQPGSEIRCWFPSPSTSPAVSGLHCCPPRLARITPWRGGRCPPLVPPASLQPDAHSGEMNRQYMGSCRIKAASLTLILHLERQTVWVSSKWLGSYQINFWSGFLRTEVGYDASFFILAFYQLRLFFRNIHLH